jgi:hypothetical protein
MVDVSYQMVLSTLQTVGLLVGIAYYVMSLNYTRRNQELTLKAQQQSHDTRRGQYILDSLLFASSKEALDHQVDHIFTAKWSSYDEWEDKYWKDPEYQKAFYWLASSCNALGTLIQEGIIDVHILAVFNAEGFIYNWEKHRDLVYEHRKRWKAKRYGVMWEYLYDELLKYLEEHPELAP